MLWSPSPSAPMTEAGTPTLQLPSACTTPVRSGRRGNRDHVARCRAARLAGDNLRTALLAGIENIVARYGIDRNYGCGGINGEIGGG